MTMQSKDHKTLTVGSPHPSYYSAKFGGHRYCGRADIRFLNLPRDHVIKKSRDFEGGVSLLQVITLPSLVA